MTRLIALAWRTVAVAFGLVVVRGLAATALGVTGVPAPLGAVMANALLTAFVLVGVAAHLHGSRRERAIPLFLLALGIESSSLAEAVLFPLGIPGRELARIWVMDAVVDASVAALAVVLQGGDPSPPAAPGAGFGTAWRLAGCVVVYVFAYFAAGTLVWPYVSGFYAALGMPPQGLIVLVQVARGAVYAALVLMLVRRMSASRSTVALWAGLAFSVLGGIAPLLLPNPYMPEAVRMAHLWEVGVSNLAVGALAGWLLGGGAARPAAVRTGALALAALAAVVSGAAGGASATQDMATLLKARAALVNPLALSLVVNDRRADLFARELARPLPLAERLALRGAVVVELINAGRVHEALAALNALEDDARTNDPAGWPRHRTGVRMLEVIAYLRMAEDQNCHLVGSRDACLAPIRGQGVHQRREGSTRALAALNAVLARAPQDLRARWLLNVAHMTLGSYPSGVPARFRIPPAAFASTYALPRFDNVAREAGLDVFGLAGGAILDDFDRDGRLDVMLSGMGFADQMRLFRNNGDGSFVDTTESAGLVGEVGGLNMVQADYDNDGSADVLVLRGGWMGAEGRFPLSLLRNNGDGTFLDVTREAGLLRLAPSQTATWLDYDGDGRLDLFVGNESSPGAEHPCELYHNDGNGRFSERAKDLGLDYVGFVKAVVSGDYDNDGRPDLYVSVWGGDNLLFRNGGPASAGSGWRFTNVAAAAGVAKPRASFGAFFFDYDNDGWLDLFVVGYGRASGGMPQVEDVAADYLGLPHQGEHGRLYRNRGDGTFEDVTKAARLDKEVPGMGLNFGDLDNDGWLDFYLGTGTPDLGMLVPNRMFRNDAGKAFQDVTTAGNFGHLQKGHAVCFGDVDNDGDQDVFEEMGGAYLADKAHSVLYQNPGNANAWLGLELTGVRTNRRAIGARLKVAVETVSGPRFLYRTVGSGGSFGGAPLRQEIGLGDARAVTSVEVFWPASGETQRVVGLQPRRRYLIREGTREASELVWPASTRTANAPR